MQLFRDDTVAPSRGAGDTIDDQRLIMEALRLYRHASEAATAGITVSDCRLPDLPSSTPTPPSCA